MVKSSKYFGSLHYRYLEIEGKILHGFIDALL